MNRLRQISVFVNVLLSFSFFSLSIIANPVVDFTSRNFNDEPVGLYFSAKVVSMLPSNKANENTISVNLYAFITVFGSNFGIDDISSARNSIIKSYIEKSYDISISLPKNYIASPFSFFT